MPTVHRMYPVQVLPSLERMGLGTEVVLHPAPERRYVQQPALLPQHLRRALVQPRCRHRTSGDAAFTSCPTWLPCCTHLFTPFH